MISSNTLSVLMQIQPTIQRFARMLSSVLQLEVEIVDNTLCRVAGTGAYGRLLGKKLIPIHVLIPFVKDVPAKRIAKRKRFLARLLFIRDSAWALLALLR